MKRKRISFRIKLLNEIESEFKSVSFINESKYGHIASFTRKSFFSLKRLIVFIMMFKTSYQREINTFSRKIYGGDYNIRSVTAGALTQARAKLNPWAFQRLSEVALNTFYGEAPYSKWNGHRLVAVDGSVLSLPSSPSIAEEFGKEGNNQNDKLKSMARCSLLYDVLNCVTIDAQIGEYRTSEKALFEQSLKKLTPGDVLLADRGYGYHVIIHWLNEQKVDYCIRIKTGLRKEVKQFIQSNSWDQIVYFKYDIKLRKELGLNKKYWPQKVRLVKVLLDDGSIEVLCTSLYDKTKYPQSSFKELYFKRWGVEEAYKMLKARINIEAFSGRTAKSVYQDFYAKILMMNLCATLSHPIEQKVRTEYSAAARGNKYDQKINKADALAETRDNLIMLLIKKVYQKTIDCMDAIIEASRTSIRPNRKFERHKKHPQKNLSNYKQL